MPLLLLIVTDTEDERSGLGRHLMSYGIRSHAVRTLASAYEIADQWKFDGAVFHCRGQTADVLSALSEFAYRLKGPITLLSTQDSEASQLEALRTGATAVILLPASDALVAARIHRLLEMSVRSDEPAQRTRAVKLGPLTIDPRRGTVLVGGQGVPFTSGELKALLLLASQPGDFFHRNELARTMAQGENGRGADMLICRIRKKLRQAGVSELHIDTAYGLGYRIKLGRTPAEATYAGAPVVQDAGFV